MRTSRANVGRPYRGCRPGFTLIEILVVVIIIGITGAIIVPSIGNRDDLKVSAAARVLMADLIYAQNLSITEQRNHYVVFDTVNQRYTVRNYQNNTINHPVQKSPYVVQCGTGGTNGFTQVAIESVTFVSQSDGNSYVTIGFDELGTPLSRDGTNAPTAMALGQIVLKCGAHRLRIDIEPYTGQISVTQL